MLAAVAAVLLNLQLVLLLLLVARRRVVATVTLRARKRNDIPHVLGLFREMNRTPGCWNAGENLRRRTPETLQFMANP
jgi:hypothetical protein